MKQKMHIWAAWISLLTFILTVGIFGLISYWLVFPYKIIDVSEPILIPNKELSHGDVLLYEVEFCKYMPLAGRVTNTITNGVYSFTYATVSLDNGVGCGKITSSRLVIPASVPYGDTVWRMEAHVEYNPNPFRVVKMTVGSESFHIRELK